MNNILLLAGFSGLVAAVPAVQKRATTSVPQYFQTSPELYAGPTPTGIPAFLAQTNPAPFASVSYIAPQPLETQVPIVGAPRHPSSNENIYHLHGQLSHYFSNPTGFGVEEYSLPPMANISQLHMLHRHGARYPTGDFDVVGRIQNYSYTATGQLSFLNDWNYKLGQQILVPVGKQELFDSGTLHQYQYGHLYNNNGSKIVARSTTQDRMIQSAEYFLAGFFGLNWPQNASLEVIIEQPGYNNSFAGYFECNMSNSPQSEGGTNASTAWQNVYLQDALARLGPLLQFDNATNDLAIADVYSFQSLCAYETVALGYSAFCDLFTYEEWQGYEYSVDLSFSGNDAFQAPTGRAVGVGYVQELRARLMGEYLCDPISNASVVPVCMNGTGSANTTLDSMPSTFPLNQSLYFDFSHDTNIMSILTAFGLKQFAQALPTDHMIPHDLIVSHMEPFAARLDVEVIKTPHPLSPSRSPEASYMTGGPTTYVHFILNQRTIPLYMNYDQCEMRDDGWCEIGAFLAATDNAFELSMYEKACFGDYPTLPYGGYNNGNPDPSSMA